MMTLPAIDVLRPGSVAEAVAQLAAHPGARLLAGGTDIVPNLKYGMYETRHLVALRGLSRELRYVRVEGTDGEIRLGALCTIDELARDATVRAAPAGPGRGVRADRRAAAAPHGNAGREPLPGHPLRLHQPDVLLAQRAGLLPEEGRHRVPRGGGRAALRGGCIQRYGAGAARARRERPRRLAPRRARAPARGALPGRRRAQHRSRARRAPRRSARPRAGGLAAPGVPQATHARRDRLPGAEPGGRVGGGGRHGEIAAALRGRSRRPSGAGCRARRPGGPSGRSTPRG